MSDQLEPATATILVPLATPIDPPASQPTAVDRCAAAWKRTQELTSLLPKRERHAKEIDYFVNEQAASAFRDAMPPLIGLQNIQEYIACVAYASLHEIFRDSECQRLFDCAKFALAVVAPNRVPKITRQEAQSPCQTASEAYNASKLKELTDNLLINLAR